MAENKKITKAVIDRGIGSYLRGEEGDLQEILTSLGTTRGINEFATDAFHNSYTPTGEIKKLLVNALETGQVDSIISTKMQKLGACTQSGRLTKKGIEKSITALAKVSEQVEAFNRYLSPNRKLEYQTSTGSYSGRIEDYYCTQFNEGNEFCIPEKSNVIPIIGVAFTWSALKLMMDEKTLPTSIRNRFLNFLNNPPCYDIIYSDSDDFPSQFLSDWKEAAIQQVIETEWDSFRETFLEILEKTYWVYTYKYSTEAHISEFDRLICSVSHEKLRDFFCQKFKAEIGFKGWPDLSLFGGNEISVIEIKGARDKLKIDQIKALQKLLNEVPSVNHVTVIHHRNK